MNIVDWERIKDMKNINYCALNILFEFKNIGFTNFNISIFDKSQALRTILPTGGGRCNLTNSINDIKEFASNYPRGEKFLYSVFSKFSVPIVAQLLYLFNLFII